MATLDQEHTEIMDIPNIPDQIISAARSGKLVLFIGAGVSRIIGCPSWDEFAHLQLKDIYEKKAINYHEYVNLKSLDTRKLLSICRRIYEEKNMQPPSMKSLLAGKDDLFEKFGSIYDDLYSFNAVYVTTNYDDHLDNVAKKPIVKLTSITQTSTDQDVMKKEIPRGKIISSKDQLLISNLNNGNIIHLHGSIDDEKSTIVTIVDYMKHYEHGSKPTVLLEEIFKNYTVLFVGYGLEEYEILEFIIIKYHTSKSKGEVKQVKHFMLYPVFKNEINLIAFHQKYYMDLGIQLVPYPIDKNGYEHIATVIHEWAKQIGPISQPQSFLEKIKLIDEVVS